MNYLWTSIRNIMAIIGGLLVLGGVGSSDYYVLELGQKEPANVWWTILTGFLLMVPVAIHLIRKEIEKQEND